MPFRHYVQSILPFRIFMKAVRATIGLHKINGYLRSLVH